MRKFLSCLLVFAMLVSPTAAARTFSEEEIDNTPLPVVSTAAEGEIIDIKAKSAILIEPNTGTVLYESGSDIKSAPASITKIMSLILVMEAIESGFLTFDTVLTCSDTAAALGGSQIWLEPGEQMTVHELLKAVCIVSANDATVMLAEAISGSEESFVVQMNEKAKVLGMNNTNFENCTGLDSENHYSTAYDVAVMSAELLRHEKIKDYCTVWMDSLRGGESVLVNTNKLVRFYEGCIGLKTGTTSTAGYCLSAAAKRGDLSLVAVVMSADSSAERFSGAQKLLNYGFAHFNYFSVSPDLGNTTHTKVLKGVASNVKIVPSGDFYALLKKTQAANITQTLELNEGLTAPITKGSEVGKVKFWLNETQLGEVSILAEHDVARLDFKSAYAAIIKALLSL